MKNSYEELREKYQDFIYRNYLVEEKEDIYVITYEFEVPGLCFFRPKLEIDKKYIKKNDSISKNIIFNIGMIELISYWKATCSKNVIIEAGFINDEQIKWFKKIYYYGLGELFYKNGIKNTIDDFMDIRCNHEKNVIEKIEYKGSGNLIPIGGGKDSCVTLEVLKSEHNSTSCFMINPKETMVSCAKIGGYDDDNIFSVKRIIDRKLIDLNEKGFINGHTPFSALVAFISYLIAYENNKEYIILSNEASANEETVIGTKINHQYSKTYEFENSFNYYVKNFLGPDIKYFSLLRPLNELQIAKLFSNYKKYHKIFKSCNLGSKNKEWKWCCSCPKCLFTYIILSPFLSNDDMVDIFGENLLEKKELLDTFLSLTGNKDIKPFECVGSIEEVNYAVILKIENLLKENKPLPYLLKYYLEHYGLEKDNDELLKKFNKENNLEEKFTKLLKEEVKKYVS